MSFFRCAHLVNIYPAKQHTHTHTHTKKRKKERKNTDQYTLTYTRASCVRARDCFQSRSLADAAAVRPIHDGLRAACRRSEENSHLHLRSSHIYSYMLYIRPSTTARAFQRESNTLFRLGWFREWSSSTQSSPSHFELYFVIYAQIY